MTHLQSVYSVAATSSSMVPATGTPLGVAAAHQMYERGVLNAVSLSRGRLSVTTLGRRDEVATSLYRHFLSLPADWGITVYTAQPTDVLVFVSQVWIPKHGRTRLLTGATHPAASTCRGMWAALSYLFRSHGRAGEWSLIAPWNNPCESQVVQDYRAGIVSHLVSNEVRPVAAHPLSLDKLRRILDTLDARAVKLQGAAQAYNRIRWLLCVRDAALFIYLYHSIQRGGEGAKLRLRDLRSADPAFLGSVWDSPAVLVFPRRVKNRVVGKFEVCRDPDPGLCFLARLRALVFAYETIGFPLTVDAYLFRPQDSSRRTVISNKALQTTACISRLQAALKKTGSFSGETSHSFRRGGMQRDKAAGKPREHTMSRALISTPAMYDRYTDEHCVTRYRPPASVHNEDALHRVPDPGGVLLADPRPRPEQPGSVGDPQRPLGSGEQP